MQPNGLTAGRSRSSTCPTGFCSTGGDAVREQRVGRVSLQQMRPGHHDDEVAGPGEVAIDASAIELAGQHGPAPTGAPPYDADYARGPSAGPNAWNMTAPDGVIDLLNDILGVVLQGNHDCT